MKGRNLLSKILFAVTFLVLLIGQVFAQDRPRVVVSKEKPIQKTDVFRESQPAVMLPKPVSRPILTNPIRVVTSTPPAPLVKKTVLSVPVNSPSNNYSINQNMAAFNRRLMSAMESKLGIPYVYGSTGPRSYDCSGLVWTVFQTAGLPFERTSARSYFQSFEPVYGDDRYKFGTLVFFNGLGHVGIVVDENTFYHASSSKGVTFSKFEGYWSKRIVGFRRIPMNNY